MLIKVLVLLAIGLSYKIGFTLGRTSVCEQIATEDMDINDCVHEEFWGEN